MKSLVMTESELLNQAVEIIRRWMPKDLRYRVFLFGSRATQSAGERSDYDLGIEADGKIPAGLLQEMEESLDKLRDLRRVEVVDFGNVSEEFARVAKEKVKVLYE